MNNNVLVVIGAFALLFGLSCVLILIGAVWVGKVEDRHFEEEYRQMRQEKAAQDVLRPSTGQVDASTQNHPYDWQNEAEVLKAQQYVWALHQIDSAFDRAGGEGRW